MRIFIISVSLLTLEIEIEMFGSEIRWIDWLQDEREGTHSIVPASNHFDARDSGLVLEKLRDGIHYVFEVFLVVLVRRDRHADEVVWHPFGEFVAVFLILHIKVPT